MTNLAKAVVWVAPNKMEIRKVQIPEIQDDGMLIKVNAAGICGTDAHLYPQNPPRPSILGHELTGTIVVMGKNANKSINSFSGPLKVGDRIALYPWITCGKCVSCLTYGAGACSVCDDSFVYGLPYEMTGLDGTAPYSSALEEYPYLKGGFAEYMYIFPNTFVWKLPDAMPDSIATLLDPLAVATRAVEMAIRQPGVMEDSFNTNATVLVIGDGQIGTLCALIARLMGVKQVIVAGGRSERLAIASDISHADHVLNYHDQSIEERKELIMKWTGDKGADVVFQCVGNGQAFRDGITLMKRLGTLVEVGNMVRPSPLQFDPSADLCLKHATYLGMSVNTPASFNKAFNMLTRYEELGLSKIFTHECTLDTLDDTMHHVKDPAYMKGWIRISSDAT